MACCNAFSLSISIVESYLVSLLCPLSAGYIAAAFRVVPSPTDDDSDDGSSDRPRRITKAPAKLSDYVIYK